MNPRAEDIIGECAGKVFLLTSWRLKDIVIGKDSKVCGVRGTESRLLFFKPDMHSFSMTRKMEAMMNEYCG